jgi:hypothetical protein
MERVLEISKPSENTQSLLDELLSPPLRAPTHLPTAREETNTQVKQLLNTPTSVTALTKIPPDSESVRKENILDSPRGNLNELLLTEIEQPKTLIEAEDSQTVASTPKEGSQIEERQRKEQTFFWNKILPLRSNIVTSINRSLSTVNSSVFSPVSITSSRSSISEDCIDILINSPEIYVTEKGVYVGKLKEMPPPVYLESEWLASIRIRLIKDLLPITKALPRSLSQKQCIFEPELCMVGEADTQSQNIIMKPTVWIRCGSKKCKKAIQEAVSDLEYIQTFSRGRVRVNLRAPLPAGDSEKLAIHNVLDNQDLILQLQCNGSMLNSCGKKLRIMNPADATGIAWTSTIGGLIRVDRCVYALTTAHSIFEARRQTKDFNNFSPEGDSNSEKDSCSSSLEGHIVSSPAYSDPSATYHHQREVEDFTYKDVHLALANYVGQGLDTHIETVATDFALIKMPDLIWSNGLLPLYNSYRSPTNGKIDLTSFNETPEEGEVEILYRQNEICTGWLLPGASLFTQRDGLFQTRKIQMQRPLRKNQFLGFLHFNANTCRSWIFWIMGCPRSTSPWSDYCYL